MKDAWNSKIWNGIFIFYVNLRFVMVTWQIVTIGIFFLLFFFLHKKFVILNMRLIVFYVLSDVWYRGELVINRAHTIHVKIISFISSEIWKPIIIRVSLMKWDEKEYKKSPVYMAPTYAPTVADDIYVYKMNIKNVCVLRCCLFFLCSSTHWICI